jgi:phosphotransferase system enzyme I (PtsI)
VYQPFQGTPEEGFIPKEEISLEKKRYAETQEKALKEIEAIREVLEASDPEKAKIFTAHRDILKDPAMQEEIAEGIETAYWTADWAIWKVYAKFIKLIQKARDPVIRERTADFEDVRKRLIRLLRNIPESNLSRLPEPVIIAARDLLPSDTATLDRRNVLAILTETGGAASHSAIIARSYEIPAILGIPNLLELLRDHRTAGVDAFTGEVFLSPASGIAEVLTEKREQHRKKTEEIKVFLKKEPLTADGQRIAIGLNIGNAQEEELAGADCTDYAGLFRTEFLYMGRNTLPGEDEQCAIYRKVLERYGKRPVTLRTLDIGGDKTLDCMELPKEANPFLGNRALRLCFAHPDLFKTQLRAALRASVYGNLHLMFPMVGSIDDIRRAKYALKEAAEDLDREKVRYSPDLKVGIMIEIPAIALIADLAAKEVDFASIGTNDLCQYLTAVDRMNPDLRDYYQSYHPAMFRLIGAIARAFTQAGKSVSVCGEMGGDPLAGAVLVGLGIRKLSMGLSQVAQIKRMLTRFAISEMEEFARTVQGFATAREAETYLKEMAG